MEKDITLQPSTNTIEVTESTVRLDKFLAQHYPEISRSYIQKLIEQGCVLVDKQKAKVSQKLDAGDKISITIPPLDSPSLVAEEMPLDVVYEDVDIIVINKAAGLTVHPSPGHTNHTLVNALLARYPELANFGASLRPGIVHRLDKDTSGLMIIAKNSAAQQNLINQFKNHKVSKGYLALVKGKVTPSRGLIEAPIGRHPSNRKRMAVVTKGREATTGYKVKEYIGNNSLLEIYIKTGRTHQIRVHLAAIGYPVIGDSTYGVKSTFLKRQFLHAYRLGFNIPSTGEYKAFTSELPLDLKTALDYIKR
jgi:23S rRNA pseudouridine1911/1915/1917 synthase